MEYRYWIVKGTGKAHSRCHGHEGEIITTVREGSAWAGGKDEAIENFKLSHSGYFIEGTDSWDAREMTQQEIKAWEKNGDFPTL